MVAVALRPRTVRESAEGFRQYLALEGAPEALERYGREGRLPTVDSVTRRYAKYAKTIVEVGRGGSRAFGRPAGHPAEFVPLTDPRDLQAGDTLAVRLLYRGRPLAGARVRAGAAPTAGRTAASPAAAPPTPSGERAAVDLVTDEAGVARVPVAVSGLWNVRTIQIVPADSGSGADWDVHWATLVFQAGDRGAAAGAPGGAAARGGAADSSAVAAVVARYHRALAEGDSATALSLLAPDAVVLESGGVETRDEYRSHHLPGDIQFARAVRSDRSPVRVTVSGDVAWASSTSTTRGEFRGRAVNSAGAELMVLSREAGGAWRIRAIHWSSRTRRP